MLEIPLSVGKLGICFPECSGLSPVSTYLPVDSSEWQSCENVNLSFILRIQLSS